MRCWPRPPRTPAGLAAAEQPRTAAVQHQSFDDERSVEVSFRVEDERSLVAKTGGTLTWSGCVPGVPVTSGAVLLRVDERPVVALHTDVPLYRGLKAGDKGADVEALQRELGALGHPVTVTGKYDAATTKAVKKLFTDAGVTPPGRDAAAPRRGLDARAHPDPEHLRHGAGQPDRRRAGGGDRRRCPDGRDLPGAAACGTARATSPCSGSGPRGAGRRRGHRPGVPGPGRRHARLRGRPGEQGRQKPKATLALTDPVDALKVPPTALFAIEGTSACVQQGDEGIPVSLVGSGLGASLVQPVRADVVLTRLTLGDAITLTTCDDGQATS